jgi:hypothetical protein
VLPLVAAVVAGNGGVVVAIALEIGSEDRMGIVE